MSGAWNLENISKIKKIQSLGHQHMKNKRIPHVHLLKTELNNQLNTTTHPLLGFLKRKLLLFSYYGPA